MAPTQPNTQGGFIFLAGSLLKPILPPLDLAKHRHYDGGEASHPQYSQSARVDAPIIPITKLSSHGILTHRGKRPPPRHLAQPFVQDHDVRSQLDKLPPLPLSAREAMKALELFDAQPTASTSFFGAEPQPFGTAPQLADVFVGARLLDSTATVRGGLDKMISQKQAIDCLLAQRRREAARVASEASRQQVVSRNLKQKAALQAARQHVEQLTPLAVMPMQTPRRKSCISNRAFTASPLSRTESKDDSRGEDLAGLEDTMGESTAPRPTMGGTCAAEDPSIIAMRAIQEQRQSRILSHLHHKTSKESRLENITEARQHTKRQSRMQKLLDARKSEFEKLPEKEREILKDVFTRYMGHGGVDPNDLIHCLRDLGMNSVTQAESRDITELCTEASVVGDVDFFQFSFDLVPKVRSRLLESRKETLYLEFQTYDKDRSGKLDAEECQEILERLCTGNLDPKGLDEMERNFKVFVKEVADANGLIGFEQFQVLVERCREFQQRIVEKRVADLCKKEAIDASEKRYHADELVLLHDSFVRADTSGDGRLDKDEIGHLLIEYRLWPRSAEKQEAVVLCFTSVDKDNDGQITFSEYLTLVRKLRQEGLDNQESHLREIFVKFDQDKSKKLCIAEISNLLAEIGIQPKSREEQVEMKTLFDDLDVDKSGDLDFQEFLELVMRLQQRLGVFTRRRQRVTANKLGYDDSRIRELRECFWTLDVQESTLLGTEQLRQALNIMKKPLSAEDLHDLAIQHGVPGICEVDFEGFLHLFKDLEIAEGLAPPRSEDMKIVKIEVSLVDLRVPEGYNF